MADELRGGARPAGWDAELARAIRHPVLYVRWFAMTNAPAPASPAMVAAIGANMASEHIDVQAAACATADRLSLTSLGPTTVRALRTAVYFVSLDPCFRAAAALGARGRAVDVLVDRLGDRDVSDAAFCTLVALFAAPGFGSFLHTGAETGKSLTPAWRAFVSAHRTSFDAGAPIEP